MTSQKDGAGHGAFYTPDDIANQHVLHALRYYFHGRGGRDREPNVLDPACGDGAILKACHRAGVPATHLHGIDLDPVAVVKAREWLDEALAAEGCDKAYRDKWVPRQIIQGDALLDDLDDWLYEDGESNFDVVIGNPPWIGQVSKDLGSAYAKAVAKRFKPYNAAGDLCSAFVRRAAEIAPQVSLLCTNTVFEGRTRANWIDLVRTGWAGLLVYEDVRHGFRPYRHLPARTWPNAAVQFVELHLVDTTHGRHEHWAPGGWWTND